MKSFVLIISSLLILLTNKCSSQPSANLPVNAFEQGMLHPQAQLLDVRTMNEFNNGHLKNALQADWNNDVQFKERVQALDKSKPVYTYCLSGARSDAATKWLNENGFTAYNMQGGIAAWKKAGKPLEAAKAVKQITLEEYMAQLPTDKTVLLDVGATWCPPCIKMNPVIDSLAAANQSKIYLQRIDGGDQTTLVEALHIDAFPTFIIFKKGKEVWRKQGITDPAELAKAF